MENPDEKPGLNFIERHKHESIVENYRLNIQRLIKKYEAKIENQNKQIEVLIRENEKQKIVIESFKIDNGIIKYKHPNKTPKYLANDSGEKDAKQSSNLNFDGISRLNVVEISNLFVDSFKPKSINVNKAKEIEIPVASPSNDNDDMIDSTNDDMFYDIEIESDIKHAPNVNMNINSIDDTPNQSTLQTESKIVARRKKSTVPPIGISPNIKQTPDEQITCDLCNKTMKSRNLLTVCVE